MLYSIKNRECSGKLEELASIQNQVEDSRLQDKLGKQNFLEDMKKLNEIFTDINKKTSRDITKPMTEAAIKNKKVLENLNNKLLEIMIIRGIKTSFYCLFYLKSLILNILVNLS